MEPTTTKHVECRGGVCGGKPCVAGTRIRVWDIHVWHDLRGQSPEEIVASYPQLSLADVHAALAYFLDHREAIQQQVDADQTAVAKEQTKQEPTRFSQLRDDLLKGNNGNADSVSSG